MMSSIRFVVRVAMVCLLIGLFAQVQRGLVIAGPMRGMDLAQADGTDVDEPAVEETEPGETETDEPEGEAEDESTWDEFVEWVDGKVNPTVTPAVTSTRG